MTAFFVLFFHCFLLAACPESEHHRGNFEETCDL